MMGFVRKKTIYSFVFVLVYKILLDFVYINFVYKVFAYSGGFIYEPNPTKYFIGLGYLIMIFLFLPKDSIKPSSIVLQLHYLIMIIPMITLYGLANESNEFMLYIALLLLVMRDTTERPEGIAAGTLKLVGTDEEVIYKTFKQLLEDQNEYEKMSKASNPYGDGLSSKRIADILSN